MPKAFLPEFRTDKVHDLAAAGDYFQVWMRRPDDSQRPVQVSPLICSLRPTRPTSRWLAPMIRTWLG